MAIAMNEIPTDAQPTLAPVSDRERLKLVDALRGVAVLGILLMNIPGFSMPEYSSESYKSDPTNVNFWVSAVISVVFEGKMRALFGMLFGAGVHAVRFKERAGGEIGDGTFLSTDVLACPVRPYPCSFDLVDRRYPLSLRRLRHDRVSLPQGEAELSGSGCSPGGGPRFRDGNVILPLHAATGASPMWKRPAPPRRTNR